MAISTFLLTRRSARFRVPAVPQHCMTPVGVLRRIVTLKLKPGRMSGFRSRTLRSLALIVAALGLESTPAWAQATDPAMSPEWSNVRKSLEKYQDPVVALRDGYFCSVLCVQDSDGAGLGIHFVNRALFGPVVDPMKPQILLY